MGKWFPARKLSSEREYRQTRRAHKVRPYTRGLAFLSLKGKRFRASFVADNYPSHRHNGCVRVIGQCIVPGTAISAGSDVRIVWDLANIYAKNTCPLPPSGLWN